MLPVRAAKAAVAKEEATAVAVMEVAARVAATEAAAKFLACNLGGNRSKSREIPQNARENLQIRRKKNLCAGGGVCCLHADHVDNYDNQHETFVDHAFTCDETLGPDLAWIWHEK